MGVVRPCSGDKTDIVVQPDGVGELEQFLFDRLFSEGLAASHPSWSTARWAKISPRVLRRNTRRYSTASVYSSTGPPERAGCPSSGHPTTSDQTISRGGSMDTFYRAEHQRPRMGGSVLRISSVVSPGKYSGTLIPVNLSGRAHSVS